MVLGNFLASGTNRIYAGIAVVVASFLSAAPSATQRDQSGDAYKRKKAQDLVQEEKSSEA